MTFIIGNTNKPLAALCLNSTLPLQGYHSIDKDVFLSLPVVLGENGVTHVIKQTLTEAEINQLKTSADTLWDVQAGIQF